MVPKNALRLIMKPVNFGGMQVRILPRELEGESDDGIARLAEL